MSTFAILAIAWIPVAVAIIIGFAFSSSGWMAAPKDARRIAQPNSP